MILVRRNLYQARLHKISTLNRSWIISRQIKSCSKYIIQNTRINWILQILYRVPLARHTLHFLDFNSRSSKYQLTSLSTDSKQMIINFWQSLSALLLWQMNVISKWNLRLLILHMTISWSQLQIKCFLMIIKQLGSVLGGGLELNVYNVIKGLEAWEALAAKNV